MRFNRRPADSAFDRDPQTHVFAETRPLSSLETMGQATVEKTIQPGQTGRVKFKASWWSARCVEPVAIPAGELVEVVGTAGITLLVEPLLLLKASVAGLVKIRQVWQQKGWQLQQPESRIGGAAIIVLTEDEASPGGIAAETWQRFLERKPIYVNTFKACCEVLGLKWQDVVAADPVGLPVNPEQPSRPDPVPAQAQVSVSTLNFVGRHQAMLDLAQLQQTGAKVITILGSGGLGKTTLAREYLNQPQFDLVLECWMAKQTQNLTPAENIVQEWLQRLGEQPGRKFEISLERLRRCLCQSVVKHQPVKIGVLIDNLESALDRQGQLIAAHRQYAALLEVLADPRVQSLTLVTSREPLHEVYVTVQPYLLASLDMVAWRDFFAHYQILVDDPVLQQMHRAYAGNAKAMTILSSVIRVDCEGCMAAYWRENQTDLLADPSLEGLVEGHFTRLNQLYPEAYRLLYRLGCYRYQQIANVPLEGLLTLLWDVPVQQHQRVVRFLRDLFLVEVSELGYRLHPTIQVKAVEILRHQPEWQRAHQQAAAFWTAQVEQITTIEAALMALEAYHHQVQIQDWEAAAAVILHQRSAEGSAAEPLGVSFYRLGLLQPMIAAITRIIRQIQPGQTLGNLHRILGDLFWLTGSLHQALACHDHACAIATAYKIPALELVSLFNIGLCKLDLWELEDAFQLFNTVNARAADPDLHRFAVGSWFCLALLHAYRGEREQASQYMRQVSQQFTEISFSAWSRCYSLLFLGQAAQHLGELDNAQRFYDLAQLFAERSQYPQVKAKALTGQAAIYRQQADFQGALTHLAAAKALFDSLEARGDLAEVHYQIGLTYAKLNDLAASQTHLQTAVQLFQQIRAPRQVERVQQTLQMIASQSPE